MKQLARESRLIIRFERLASFSPAMRSIEDTDIRRRAQFGFAVGRGRLMETSFDTILLAGVSRIDSHE
jgi:hypothetical protein